MIYTYKEVKEKYKDNYNINKAIKNKELYKLEKGIYSDKRNVNPVIIYSKKYPNSVITMDSAFFYYNLTDTIPEKVSLATNRNCDTILNDEIIQYFLSKDNLSPGKTIVVLEGEKVNMYDKERLLIELIRRRNKVPYDYYKEIINNYRKISEELDMRKIEDYLSLYKNDYSLSKVLLREVF